MYRLGLQLALKGGREALVRLLVTTFAVAVGVSILLGVFADFHAFQQTSNRPSWESTSGTSLSAESINLGDKIGLLLPRVVKTGVSAEPVAGSEPGPVCNHIRV